MNLNSVETKLAVLGQLRQLRDQIIDILDSGEVGLIELINLQYISSDLVNNIAKEGLPFEEYQDLESLPDEVKAELLDGEQTIDDRKFEVNTFLGVSTLDLDNYQLQFEEDGTIKVYKFEERI
jgi:hypothetical protein